MKMVVDYVVLFWRHMCSPCEAPGARNWTLVIVNWWQCKGCGEAANTFSTNCQTLWARGDVLNTFTHRYCEHTAKWRLDIEMYFLSVKDKVLTCQLAGKQSSEASNPEYLYICLPRSTCLVMYHQSLTWTLRHGSQYDMSSLSWLSSGLCSTTPWESTSTWWSPPWSTIRLSMTRITTSWVLRSL